MHGNRLTKMAEGDTWLPSMGDTLPMRLPLLRNAP